ncbi:DUF559 domain-containing protein [Aldersonia sp. NBC_00410]|uniref:endonuclease domain-containing protein n=1 Tax=Aldersonia sp. NBC_00410 TaxID=2975954 RepID=UPI002258F702|nr:DUF559 domain-containing protein [Aldersonia sp. NBC_00410]MCX5042926.1 DUF559 domain-containing protein [Aldersonia sp. NBC_00410]
MDDFGIRTRAQLLGEGVAGSTIDYRCRRGRYHRVLPGVYSLCLAVLPRLEADALIDKNLATAFGAEELRLLVKQAPGRYGNGAVARQLRVAAQDFASEPERLLARAFTERRFRIAPNAPVGPFVGDFVDERARLVVEVDGREFHSEPGVFRQDRRRQNWMLVHGWMVLRYAAWDVLAGPGAVADEVIAIARRRRKALG